LFSGNFLFIYGHEDTPHIYIRSPYYTVGVFDNNGCSLSFQMHTNVTVPSQVSIMLKTDNYTSLIQDNVENNTPTWVENYLETITRHENNYEIYDLVLFYTWYNSNSGKWNYIVLINCSFNTSILAPRSQTKNSRRGLGGITSAHGFDLYFLLPSYFT